MAHLYESLDSATEEIRLLRLRPGSKAAMIDCHLEKTNLGTRKAYEAVSYVWGSRALPETVLLNDLEKLVTQNLHQALQHLRYPDRDRLLWVDALCINQKDDDEKTQQVQLMCGIYKEAVRTVVWLGDFGAEGRLAMEFIRSIARHGAAIALQPGSQRARDTLPLVLQCKWWQRVWVVQELVMSTGDPILQSGDVSLLWTDFVKFFETMLSPLLEEWRSGALDGSRWDVLESEIASLSLLRKWSPQQRQWAHLVHLTSRCLATDPRDRIFALHGLTSAHAQTLWRPDYRQDIVSVYTGFMEHMIQSHMGLDFMCYRKPRARVDLPSWVPDFSSSCWYADTDRFEQTKTRADAGIAQETNFSSDSRTLTISGFRFDVIEDVVRSGSFNSIERLRGVYAQARKVQQAQSSPFKLLHRSKHIADILGCRSRLYEPAMAAKFDLMFGGRSKISARRGFDTDAIVRDLLPTIRAMQEALEAHSFFTTKNGFAGMGPTETRKGDLVVIVLGCVLPLVLRADKDDRWTPSKTASSTGTWTNSADDDGKIRWWNFVGACGIPTIANGEWVRACQRSRPMCAPEVKRF